MLYLHFHSCNSLIGILELFNRSMFKLFLRFLILQCPADDFWHSERLSCSKPNRIPEDSRRKSSKACWIKRYLWLFCLSKIHSMINFWCYLYQFFFLLMVLVLWSPGKYCHYLFVIFLNTCFLTNFHKKLVELELVNLD